MKRELIVVCFFAAVCMRGYRKFSQRGSNFDPFFVFSFFLLLFFFFFISLMKGGRIQIPLLAGHFAGGPMVTQH